MNKRDIVSMRIRKAGKKGGVGPSTKRRSRQRILSTENGVERTHERTSVKTSLQQRWVTGGASESKGKWLEGRKKRGTSSSDMTENGSNHLKKKARDRQHERQLTMGVEGDWGGGVFTLAIQVLKGSSHRKEDRLVTVRPFGGKSWGGRGPVVQLNRSLGEKNQITRVTNNFACPRKTRRDKMRSTTSSSAYNRRSVECL